MTGSGQPDSAITVIPHSQFIEGGGWWKDKIKSSLVANLYDSLIESLKSNFLVNGSKKRKSGLLEPFVIFCIMIQSWCSIATVYSSWVCSFIISSWNHISSSHKISQFLHSLGWQSLGSHLSETWRRDMISGIYHDSWFYCCYNICL